MSGVLFIVTIPTECYEWEQDQVLLANTNGRSTETEIDPMSKVIEFNINNNTYKVD